MEKVTRLHRLAKPRCWRFRESGLPAIWGEAIASCPPSVFPLYPCLSISSDGYARRHSATDGGAEQPQMCSEASWSCDANEVVWNRSGRCLSPDTPEAGCCWQVSVSPFLSSRLPAPAITRLSASALSTEGRRSSPARLTSCHKLFAWPLPSSRHSRVRQRTVQQCKR